LPVPNLLTHIEYLLVKKKLSFIKLHAKILKTMNSLITVALLGQALSQDQSILNTMLNTFQSNYTIGFVNNSCTRVSMFKFLSLGSGIASSITIQFVYQLPSVSTNISLSLFSFSNNQQIGKTFTSLFNTNYNGITDIRLANWTFTSGKLYYLTIQPVESDYVKIPWGTDSRSTMSVVLQQGSSCDTNQWAQYVTNNASYIPVQIFVKSNASPFGTAVIGLANNTPNQNSTWSSSQTTSQTNMPSASQTNMPSASQTNMPTANQTNIPTASQTHVPTASETPSLKPPTPSIDNSVSQSYINSNSFTPTSQNLRTSSSAQPPAPQETPALIASSFFAALFGFGTFMCFIYYLRESLDTSKRNMQLKSVSPGAALQESAKQEAEPVKTQTLSPLIIAMPSPNMWQTIIDGPDKYYYNSKTKESVWVLPPGETAMD